MDSAKHNLGEVEKIRTEAIGVAGKRIFRILIDCPTKAAATLWLEKEQVYGLSMAMKKMAEAKGQGERSDEEPEFPDIAEVGSTPVSSEGLIEVQGKPFGAGVWSRQKPRHRLFSTMSETKSSRRGERAEEEEYEEEAVGPAALQVSLAHAQLDEFINQSLDECSSGRGTDALSRHAMVATGKVDPNTNGHFRH